MRLHLARLPFFIARRNVSTLAPSLTLRPYQEECIEACLSALRAGSSRFGVSLPTGTGKTTVFVCLLSRIAPPPQNPGATRSLIIVNAIELATQAKKRIKYLFPDWSVEIEQGRKHKASGLADVTIATYQSLKRRLKKFDPHSLKAIIIDEAHHAAAKSYRYILSHFHPQVEHPRSNPGFVTPALNHTIPIIGFSATFSRHDKLPLYLVFKEIVYHTTLPEMVKEGWLCEGKFTSVKAEFDLGGVATSLDTGDFNSDRLASVVNTDSVNAHVVQTWLDCASTRRSTLVFCVNISHVKNLTNAFQERGIDARCIHSKLHARERQALLKSFENGEFPVLVNCFILTEGVDIPSIDCILLVRPTKSQNSYTQMIGRGMRHSPDTSKKDCMILDILAKEPRVAGAFSAPNLFGLPPSDAIEGETVQSLEQRVKDMASTEIHGPELKSSKYIDHENAYSFFRSPTGENLSTFAWMEYKDNVFVLLCYKYGFIRIEPDDQKGQLLYRAFYCIKKAKRTLARGIGSLKAIIGMCDDFVKGQVNPKNCKWSLSLSYFYLSADWRNKPASEKQMELVKKIWYQGGTAFKLQNVSYDEDMVKLKKGQASDLIFCLSQKKYEQNIPWKQSSKKGNLQA